MQLRNNYYLKYICALIIFIFATCCNCSDKNSNNLSVTEDDAVIYERENRNRNLKKTKLAYLDDLSSTQSASVESSAINNRKVSKFVPKKQLESIKEESNGETIFEASDVEVESNKNENLKSPGQVQLLQICCSH